jgi:hypothetical protein
VDWPGFSLPIHFVPELAPRRITAIPRSAIANAGYYAARQRRAIAVTRQRTLAGRRHHAARQRGALANGTQGPDQHPTLASNVVMCELTFSRLVSAIVPR